MQSKWTHGGLATALLLALIVTGWKVSLVIGTLQGWEAWNQPKIAADLLQACIYGLIALGAGLGLNLGTLLNGFGVSLGPKEPS